MKSRAVKIQGIDCPIIREKDNIVDIVVNSVLEAVKFNVSFNDKLKAEHLGLTIPEYDLQDKAVLGITESVVARSLGQYVTIDDIAKDTEEKYGKGAEICLINPIYSRNRFSMILRGIARAAKKVVLVMPEFDEVGNPRGTNPFTGINIEEFYKQICREEHCECEIDKISDELQAIHTNLNVLLCDLRDKIKKGISSSFVYIYTLKNHKVYSLSDMCSSVSPDWGLLGTNIATEEKLKLFPSKAECKRVCKEVKEKLKEKTGKDIICAVYGDGAFKDPVGGIWEFADPTTMPGYTDEELLESTPNEVKLKSLIDSNGKIDFEDDDDLINFADRCKNESQKTSHSRQGTTPRIYRDLLASLMDLTSGSGDRATPVVLIQNYF